MPLEGHWARQRTPLRRVSRREGWAMALVASLLAIAAGVAIYLALSHGGPKTAAGCVDVTAASSTGGATLHACGDAAARLCRSQATRADPFARAVQERCARAGYR